MIPMFPDARMVKDHMESLIKTAAQAFGPGVIKIVPRDPQSVMHVHFSLVETMRNTLQGTNISP